MSKIEELIMNLCPEGVPYIKLKEMAEVGTGSSDRKDADDAGEFPFYVRSKDVLRINKYEYDETAIVIPGEGGIGEIFHYVEGKYALHQRAYRIHVVDDKLDTKYLYYYMFSSFKNFIMKKAVTATVTSIRKPMIEEFPIAVPPLDVQQEIVRLLDDFTQFSKELSSKLSIELNARQKQYEYYRNILVNKEKNKCLCDILKIKNGKDYKAFGEGNIPVYGSGGIMTYTSKFAYDKPSVLIPRKGSIDKLYYVEEPFWNVDTIFYTEINENVAIPKYIFYCLENEHLEELNTAGGVPSLTQGVLNNVKIHIPSINEQKEIVNKLDRLNNLVNDTSKKLQSEIDARKKQYEYYRDKLLTFKELVNEG